MPVDEVQSICQQFPSLTIESPSMRCVGYRQTCLYLDNKINFAELRDMGIAATRQLAKRQLTWLRSMKTDAMQEFDCLVGDLSNQVRYFLHAEIRKY